MTPEIESAGIAATLGLNYKLFLAQLINFGLIVLVIWKFVYGPLAKAMDERTAKIDRGLKDAADAKAMVENAAAEREKVITESRLRAKEIIESAEADAKKRRDEMIAGAKSEVERVVVEGKQRLRDDQAAMIEDVRQQVAELVLSATEKVTGEKMDAKKDAALIKKALENVG
ncbi:MAG: F0F1 ATP synthase subunit B [Patescibacteria group bacterium]